MTERHAHDPNHVAEKLDCSRETVFRLIKDGHLPSFTVGRKRLVSERALQKFIADRESVVS
jgi:excisionase family DNA binding protein